MVAKPKLLSKSERFKFFIDRLKLADLSTTRNETLSILKAITNGVEDEYDQSNFRVTAE